jgi:uncharacterized protein (TIGR03083 family)
MRQPEVVTGVFTQYETFAGLIAPLTADEWHAPTRCAGWQVRDVAGHVVGNAVDSLTGRIGTRTPDEQARAFRDETPSALAERLRGSAARLRPFFAALSESDWAAPSPVAGRSLGNGILTLWYDTFVHGDDIRTALDRGSERDTGLRAGIEWIGAELERLGWGPATLALDGCAERRIGTGGRVLRGDPLHFLLVASGRADPNELGLDATVNVHAPR